METTTKEEWLAELARLFPAEIVGFKRPENGVPTDLEFGTYLPPLIAKDGVKYDQINAYLRQLLSSDKDLKENTEAIKSQLANCDLRLVTEALKGLMSPEMLKKLNGIATGANNYAHPNSGIAAGTYKSVSVNAQGHVTAGTNPTTLAGYGITDAAAKSHGNHVPTLETANNARFLRNDATWQTVTPGDIGAAPIIDAELTGTPTAPTPTADDSSTKLATTEFVKAALITGGGGIVAGSLEQNGWVKFSNGLILQWGRISNAANNYGFAIVPLPIRFNTPFIALNSYADKNTITQDSRGIGALTNATVTVGYAPNAYWLAIGI